MRINKTYALTLACALTLGTILCSAQDASLKEGGTTYGRAQVSAWIAPQEFAVAR